MAERGGFMEKMKAASQRFAGAVADTGAKALLKTDVIFLEKDIQARKQAFGVEVYDILKENSLSNTTAAATLSAPKIQAAYEKCWSDVDAIERKVAVKKGEMEAIERSGGGGGGGGSSTQRVPMFDDVALDEAETPGLSSNP